ncbi:bifunctional enoyl-CoA hydratase/phosphate acetyltransferase [bacterium]|nr:bifunctional enoyl-CoA hydratase/phosphate acetyltransferase [bacterium]
MTISKLTDLITLAKSGETKRMAVAAAADKPVLEAVFKAMSEKIVKPILVGDKKEIEEISKELNQSLDGIDIIDEKLPKQAVAIAVALIREGKADILMKGLVSSADLLRGVLNKEKGLRKGSTISHVALFEIPTYHKLLAVTDAAMNVAPNFKEKVAIVNNTVELFHKLGVKQPKVAVVAAVETVNEKMEATVHAAMLTSMCKRNQIKGCILDGPLAVDNAVSKEACDHKGIVSEVGGDSDIIVCPDIEAANVMYKTLNFLAGAKAAAVIMGASVPIVLTSRADTNEAKHFSIALAAAMN